LTLILWLVFALLIGFYASTKKNRGFLNWTLIAMLISPLIAFVIVAVIDSK